MQDWNPDQTGRHGFRWFSGGKMTDLVHDGDDGFIFRESASCFDDTTQITSRTAAEPPPPTEHPSAASTMGNPRESWSRVFFATARSGRRQVRAWVFFVVAFVVVIPIVIVGTAFPKAAEGALGVVVVVIIAGIFLGGSVAKSDRRSRTICPRCGHRGFKPARGVGGMLTLGIFAPKIHSKCPSCGFRIQ